MSAPFRSLWPPLTIRRPALAHFEAATDRLCGDEEGASSDSTHLATVVTATTGAQSNSSLVALALSNQRTWSSRAGAAHVVDTRHYAASNGTAVPPHFAKIFALKRALERAAPGQWVLWVDTDVIFTAGTAALASLAERLRRAHGKGCQVFFDGGYWTNSGVILMQRSCAAARLLDAWLALTDFNQLAADQGPFDLAVLHAVLGLTNATRSADVLRARPCVREPPGGLVPCVDRARRRAPLQAAAARRVCGATSGLTTGWSQWTPGSLLAHFAGAGKQCMAPFARAFRDGDGWREQPNATWVRATKCRCSRGLREMCCAAGNGGGCLCEHARSCLAGSNVSIVP